MDVRDFSSDDSSSETSSNDGDEIHADEKHSEDSKLEDEASKLVREEIAKDALIWRDLKHREVRQLFRYYLDSSIKSPSKLNDAHNLLDFYLKTKKLDRKCMQSTSRKLEKIYTSFLAEEAPRKIIFKFEVVLNTQGIREARYSVVESIYIQLEQFKLTNSWKKYQSHKMSHKIKSLFHL